MAQPTVSNSIDDIINTASMEYRLEVTPENRQKYVEFLKRQLCSHPAYAKDHQHRITKKAYHALLVDILLIFAYLTRRRKVKQSTHDSEGTLLDSDEKLHLLRAIGNDASSWDDLQLCGLYMRRGYGHRAHKLPSYTALIDEIGKDEEVVKIWGRELSYDRDLSAKERKYISAGCTRPREDPK